MFKKKPKDELKNFGPKEKAKLYTYDVESSLWKEENVKIQIAKNHFSEGGIRAAFHALLYFPKKSQKPSRTMECVVKISKKPVEEHIYFTDVAMQMYAKWWAQKYNARKPPKEVTFVDAYVIRLSERKNQPVFGVEQLITGNYVKHSDNNGYVNSNSNVPIRNTPHTFSHFTYEASARTLIIVDIQGVSDFYTDPQIHTVGRRGFGLGNLGEEGIQKFLETHQCNPICQYLGLPNVNEKPDQQQQYLVQIQQQYQSQLEQQNNNYYWMQQNPNQQVVPLQLYQPVVSPVQLQPGPPNQYPQSFHPYTHHPQFNQPMQPQSFQVMYPYYYSGQFAQPNNPQQPPH